MNDQQLLQVADAAATSLPGVSFEHRESPHWETYKVVGKVFLLMTDLPGYPLITIKADPDDAVTLQEQYVEISAGYHTDKRHWVSVTAGSGIDDRVVRGLVRDSYDLVVEKLPASVRASIEPHHTEPTS